jgi:exopolysaccharide production protein ExoQ
MQREPSPFSSRLTALARPQVLIGLIVFLAPVLALYVPLALATLLPVAVLFTVIGRIGSGAPRFRPNTASSVFVAGLIVTAAASVGWSYATDLTWDKLPRTALIAVAGMLLVAAASGLGKDETRSISKSFIAGIILTLVLIVIERFSGGLLIRTDISSTNLVGFLNQFNRPLSIVAIMIWPAAVILADKRPVYGIGLIAITLMMFATFQTGAATAAVVFGTLVFGGVYAAPRIMAPLTGAFLGIAVLLAPTIEHVLPPPKVLFERFNLPRSAYHRLLVWEFTSAKIAERPVLGWGFNTSRTIPGGKDNLDASEAALPLHPHNAALQWRLELGILGALFGAGLFVVGGVSARRYGRNRVAQAGAAATMASAFTIGMLSFGAWQSWWLSGLFIITAIAALVCRNPEQPTEN